MQDLGGVEAAAQHLGLPANAVEHLLTEAAVVPVWMLTELVAAWETASAMREEAE